MNCTVQEFIEGATRGAVIRRLLRFFSADIIVDEIDEKIKTLNVVLLPPKKGYITDYNNVGPPGKFVCKVLKLMHKRSICCFFSNIKHIQ